MEMPQSTSYQLRIDEQEKAETFAVFREMGINPAQAVRLFFRQVRKTHALPFPIEHTPNDKVAQILLQDDSKKDLKRFKGVDDLFDDLNN